MARQPLTVIAVLVAPVFLTVLVSCVRREEPSRLPTADRQISVYLTEPSGQEAIILGTSSGLQLTSGAGRRYRVAAGAGGGAARISAAGDDRLSLPGMQESPRSLTVTPGEGEILTVAQRRYRGSLWISAVKGKLVVLNRLPMDQYLRGVVPSEMPSSWPGASLEAQAVAARTYALSEASRRAGGGTTQPPAFDVYDTARSQVYRGVDAETEATDRAVARTHGQVLLHDGRLVHTYFHSTCGGSTSDASLFFDEPPTLPLSGRPCGHCGTSKYFEWECQLPWSRVREQLRPLVNRQLAPGSQLGSLQDLVVVATDPAGRATLMRAVHESGAVDLPAAEVRLALGASEMRSTACRLERRGDALHVTGRGWGHGVGLCQVGASNLASAGLSASEILAYYYPGAQLIRLSRGGPRP